MKKRKLDPTTSDPLDILIEREEREAPEKKADQVMDEAIKKVGGTT